MKFAVIVILIFAQVATASRLSDMISMERNLQAPAPAKPNDKLNQAWQNRANNTGVVAPPANNTKPVQPQPAAAPKAPVAPAAKPQPAPATP